MTLEFRIWCAYFFVRLVFRWKFELFTFFIFRLRHRAIIFELVSNYYIIMHSQLPIYLYIYIVVRTRFNIQILYFIDRY